MEKPGTWALKELCPFEVACLISSELLRTQKPLTAFAVMLAFDTYLRPGKLCDLRHGNVIPLMKSVGPQYGFWTILFDPEEYADPSKTGEFNDSLMVGTADRRWISAALSHVFSSHKGHFLFPIFEDDFQAAEAAWIAETATHSALSASWWRKS